MKRAWLAGGLVTAGLVACTAAQVGHALPTTLPAGTPLARPQIVASMERMADAQLALYKDSKPIGWVAGAFYTGLARLSHVSEEKRFTQAMLDIAERRNWKLGTERGSSANVAFGDNQCVGQMYIDLAQTLKDPTKIAAMREQMDGIIAQYDNPTPENLRAWDNNIQLHKAPIPWWWCDALYMVPNTLVGLSNVTGDRKYMEAMEKEWWLTSNHLYDSQEHLYFRDNRFKGQTTPGGKKVFWSRGNGWVFAGLANVLTNMPRDFTSRSKYEQQFKEMAAALKAVQGEDGLWRGSLLDAPSAPTAETSGTAFFCYGMAWGINNGLLDRATYEPAVLKAWGGLNTKIRSDGLIGSVQKIGDRPEVVDPEATQAYAVGAYLLSGCEIIKLLETR